MKTNLGTIGWIDLTVPEAPAVRDFYRKVVGWNYTEVDMGGYSDYCMGSPDAEVPAAGICHRQGANADLPAQWIMYITVADLDQALAACSEGGGKAITPVKEMGGGRYAIIQDPAGAVCALYQAAAAE